MNFLRYPLTSQDFFLNQKNPHRAKFGEPKLSGEVHPEPHLMQGSTRPHNPTHLMCTLTDALGLELSQGKNPFRPTNSTYEIIS